MTLRAGGERDREHGADGGASASEDVSIELDQVFVTLLRRPRSSGPLGSSKAFPWLTGL